MRRHYPGSTPRRAEGNHWVTTATGRWTQSTPYIPRQSRRCAAPLPSPALGVFRTLSEALRRELVVSLQADVAARVPGTPARITCAGLLAAVEKTFGGA